MHSSSTLASSLNSEHYCSQKFGSTLVARDLKVKGGYKPGSDISRNLVAYSNIYW